MKNFLIAVAFVCVSQFGFTQEINQENSITEDNNIYNTAGIDVKPEYKGGIKEFYGYLSRNYKTPKVVGLNGKIFTTFVVEKDGSLTDIKVIRDIGYGTGKEAIRVLKECPSWIPGEKNGQKVRVMYSLPISIQQP